MALLGAVALIRSMNLPPLVELSVLTLLNQVDNSAPPIHLSSPGHSS